MKCERCRKETNRFICSMFNTQMICMDCKKKETQHKDYEFACKIEHDEVVKGNYNYQGIGKPNDL